VLSTSHQDESLHYNKANSLLEDMKELYQRGHSLKREVKKMLIFIHLDMEIVDRRKISVIMTDDMERKAKQRTLVTHFWSIIVFTQTE
jgi:hypothetical protein